MEIPDSYARDLRCGLVHQAAGRWSDAARCWQQAYRSQPERPEALLLLSILARRSGQPEAAIRLSTLAAERQPEQACLRLHVALAHLAAGDSEAAWTWCRAALALDPSDSAALCCLGHIQAARGHENEARQAWEAAIALGSSSPSAEIALGNLLCRSREYEPALELFRAAIRKAPGHAHGNFCLAAALVALGRQEEARSAYREALRLQPAFPEALLNLGNLHYDEADYGSAVVCYRRALGLRPAYIKAWCNLGNALQMLGGLREAVRCYERVLRLDPRTAAARHNMGNALMNLGRLGRAETCFRKAVELDGSRAEHHNSLGNILFQQRRCQEAVACYEQALTIRPDYAAAHTNLANALMKLGRKTEMIRHYERAIELAPECAGSHYNLALACLRAGRYGEGWREHEWRWSFRELRLARRNFAQPQWAGEPLDGRTILLHAEQGLGDTIQFLRYVPLVTERGCRVVLEVQPRLVRLLRRFPGTERVLARGEVLPNLACHCPLMSLPVAFATTLETIPSAHPYLRADPEEVNAAWRLWPGEGLRVGLAWAGNPCHKNDRQRSMPLAELLPLAQISGVSWFALQMGPAAAQMRRLAAQVPLRRRCLPPWIWSSAWIRPSPTWPAPWDFRFGCSCLTWPTGAGWMTGPAPPGIPPRASSVRKFQATGLELWPASVKNSAAGADLPPRKPSPLCTEPLLSRLPTNLLITPLS
jgi:tetratricopeptide (TPR) repeat protein